MIAKEQGFDCLGRDTTMCGDPISWFPMRVVGKEGKHVLLLVVFLMESQESSVVSSAVSV